MTCSCDRSTYDPNGFECSICYESKHEHTNCVTCENKSGHVCTGCYSKIGKCPFCRSNYTCDICQFDKDYYYTNSDGQIMIPIVTEFTGLADYLRPRRRVIVPDPGAGNVPSYHMVMVIDAESSNLLAFVPSWLFGIVITARIQVIGAEPDPLKQHEFPPSYTFVRLEAYAIQQPTN